MAGLLTHYDQALIDTWYEGYERGKTRTNGALPAPDQPDSLRAVWWSGFRYGLSHRKDDMTEQEQGARSTGPKWSPEELRKATERATHDLEKLEKGEAKSQSFLDRLAKVEESVEYLCRQDSIRYRENAEFRRRHALNTLIGDQGIPGFDPGEIDMLLAAVQRIERYLAGEPTDPLAELRLPPYADSHSLAQQADIVISNGKVMKNRFGADFIAMKDLTPHQLDQAKVIVVDGRLVRDRRSE